MLQYHNRTIPLEVYIMAAPSKNYRELLSAIPDIHEHNYAAFYTQFSAEATQPPLAILRRTVLDASNAYPEVFVKATVVNNATQTRCILRPTRYRAPLGVTSVHKGVLYSLNGDLSSQGLPSLAVWPPQGFHCCTTTMIYTVDVVNAQLLATPGLQVFPPLVADAVDTEQGQFRFLCPHPSKYTALALQKQTYTHNEFCHTVIHQVIADGNTMSCTDSKCIRRVSGTRRRCRAVGLGKQLGSIRPAGSYATDKHSCRPATTHRATPNVDHVGSQPTIGSRGDEPTEAKDGGRSLSSLHRHAVPPTS
jgi:hypothetical protein